MRSTSSSRCTWLAALLCLAICLPGCRAEPPTRSVLLVTIDTLRADRTSPYGGVQATPVFEELADRGVTFHHAFSASSTTAPSHASILTGRYPSFHSIGIVNGRYRLADADLTLAELLRDSGYATGAVVSNPLLRASLGLDAGFEDYDDHFEGREAVRQDHMERYADRAVDLAKHWLDREAKGPFFFWLHLQDPHGPYVPRARELCPPQPAADVPRTLSVGRNPTGYQAIPDYQAYADHRKVGDYMHRYLCEVVYVDHQLGRLLAWLDADPRFAETLIVVTADHGEAMGEDDYWFAHGQSTGLDQVRVPLIVRAPGLPAGRREQRPVSNVWVFSTVLDFVGLAKPEQVEGPSLLRIARGDEGELPPIFVESATQSGVVRHGVLLRRDRPASDVPDRLPPWVAQGRRATNLRGVADEVDTASTEELLDRFDRRAREAREARADRRSVTPRNEQERDALRALGYL